MKMDITRKQISILLDGRKFSMRKVSFSGFGYGDAYSLNLANIPSGVMDKKTFEINKFIFDIVKQIKLCTYKGLPIIY